MYAYYILRRLFWGFKYRYNNHLYSHKPYKYNGTEKTYIIQYQLQNVYKYMYNIYNRDRVVRQNREQNLT